MRLLILADLHANGEAVRAIDEPFDAMVIVGDLVDWGVQPAETVDFARRHADWLVRGNHDDSIARAAATGQWERFDSHSVDQLGPERVAFLDDLPLDCAFEFGGARFAVFHGSPTDPLNGVIRPDTAEEEVETMMDGVKADFVLLGHTHVEMNRELPDGRRLVNPGSVGQQRDGDARGRYAVWEDGVVTFHHQAYDLAAAVAAVREAPLEAALALRLEKMILTGLQNPE